MYTSWWWSTKVKFFMRIRRWFFTFWCLMLRKTRHRGMKMYFSGCGSYEMKGKFLVFILHQRLCVSDADAQENHQKLFFFLLFPFYLSLSSDAAQHLVRLMDEKAFSGIGTDANSENERGKYLMMARWEIFRCGQKYKNKNYRIFLWINNKIFTWVTWGLWWSWILTLLFEYFSCREIIFELFFFSNWIYSSRQYWRSLIIWLRFVSSWQSDDTWIIDKRILIFSIINFIGKF